MCDVVRDVLLRERIEDHLVAEPVQAELVTQRVERAVIADDLRKPEACEPHQAPVSASPRNVVNQLKRRAVAPMQIFGHEQQRALCGVAIQQLAHFAEHAVLS